MEVKEQLEECPITVDDVARERHDYNERPLISEDKIVHQVKLKRYYDEATKALNAKREAIDAQDEINSLNQIIEMGKSLNLEIVQIQQATKKQGWLTKFFGIKRERYIEEQQMLIEKIRAQQLEKILQATQFMNPDEVAGARKFLDKIQQHLNNNQKIKQLAIGENKNLLLKKGELQNGSN